MHFGCLFIVYYYFNLQALPSSLASKKDVDKVEQSLKTSLSNLQEQTSDEKCLMLLKSGIAYLISIYFSFVFQLPRFII
jgi:hypothetical protein